MEKTQALRCFTCHSDAEVMAFTSDQNQDKQIYILPETLNRMNDTISLASEAVVKIDNNTCKHRCCHLAAQSQNGFQNQIQYKINFEAALLYGVRINRMAANQAVEFYQNVSKSFNHAASYGTKSRSSKRFWRIIGWAATTRLCILLTGQLSQS